METVATNALKTYQGLIGKYLERQKYSCVMPSQMGYGPVQLVLRQMTKPNARWKGEIVTPEKTDFRIFAGDS